MTYTTQQHLIDRVGEAMLIALTDRSDPPIGSIDQGTLGRALGDADAVVDGYLAGRYRLPLVDVPALVTDVATAIALWKLHVTTPEDKVKADYEAAIKSLRDIAQGVLRIPGADGVSAPVSGAQGVQITDRERPFTADNLKGFI